MGQGFPPASGIYNAIENGLRQAAVEGEDQANSNAQSSPGSFFTGRLDESEKSLILLGNMKVVPATGLEPVQCYLLEPESSASANSATRALLIINESRTLTPSPDLTLCWILC